MKVRNQALALILLASLWACSTPNEPSEETFEPEIHPQGWIEETSPSFHGDFLAAQNYDVSLCRQCHGNQFDGGLVGISCRKCHDPFPHPEGWEEAEGENSHPHYLKTHNYPLSMCRECHGENYDLVKVDNSCRTCHTNADGPEACNTCHGNFTGDPADLKNVAPPAGLDDETDPIQAAVGQHQEHLEYFADAAATCNECHVVPTRVSDPTHIDGDGEPEIIFNGPLSLTSSAGDSIQPSPFFDEETLTCRNVYCHGNWALNKSTSAQAWIYVEDQIRGNNASPVWNDKETGECGTCHDLPPKGHTPVTLQQCGGCHVGVVDAEGNIIDKSLHVNGKINVFGTEKPMF